MAISENSVSHSHSSMINDETGTQANFTMSFQPMSGPRESNTTSTTQCQFGDPHRGHCINTTTPESSLLDGGTEVVPQNNGRPYTLSNSEIQAIAKSTLSNTPMAERLPFPIDPSRVNPIQSISPGAWPTRLDFCTELSTARSLIQDPGFTQHSMLATGEANASHKSLRFNIAAAVLQQTDIMLIIAKWIDPDTLCNLYSVSRDFHHMLNGSYFAFIKASQKIWAPWGNIIFPHHYFRQCCIEDPMMMRLDRNPDQIRRIPGLIWLKMVYHRQKIVDEILYQLDQAGHRLPRDTHITIQKLWMLMSLPGNGTRIGLIHNRQYWENKDLFMATMFMMKLDMYLTDPVHGNGETSLREMILAKKSLRSLHILLHKGFTPLQLLEQFVAYDLRVSKEFAGMSILGIPSHLIGRGSAEGWGAGEERQIRIDELVMMECVKRGLHMNYWYIDMISYGYQPESDNTPLHKGEAEPRLHATTEDERVNWHLRCYQARIAGIIDLPH